MKTRMLQQAASPPPASDALGETRITKPEAVPPTPPGLPPPIGGSPARAGSFALRKLLGTGGFGEVWQAEQLSLGRTVATKRIRRDHLRPDDRATRDALEAMFQHEALTAARLEHPNIVPVYDLGVDESGIPALAMKLVQGEPWDRMIERDQASWSVEDFLARHLPILIAVANAVAFAHHRGIIHRDLKPSQVMVGAFGEVLLMDWGLAVVVGQEPEIQPGPRHDSGSIPTPLTATSPAGTVPFMAPEQTEPSAINLGTWTDIYLLGGTLYFLLTGLPPHQGETHREVFYSARRGSVRRPQLARPDREIPEELAEIAMQALAADPAARPKSAMHIVEALQDYLSGASKRRESTQLLEKATSQLATARGDYRAFGDCLTLLSNAQALWAGNPGIPAQREAALRDFASAALANGDLILARVQAERLDSTDLRADLLRQVEQAEIRVREQARQRRFAFGAVAVLLVLLAAGGTKYSVDQARARAESDRARHEAESARSRSEKLTEFMLYNLAEQLRPIGRIKLLDQVAVSALDYYKSIDPSRLAPSMARRHAKAYGIIGDVFRDEGKSDEALATQRQALALRVRNAAAAPGSTELQVDVVRSHNAIARILRARGDLPGALASAEAARKLAGEIRVTTPQDREARNELAVAYTTIGLILADQEKLHDALAAQREALSLREAAATAQPGDQGASIDLAAGHSNVAMTLQRSGDIPGALDAYRKALAIREKLAAADATNTSVGNELARTYFSIVQLLDARRAVPEALEMSARAIALRERLAAIDPLNLDWQRELAATLNLQGSLLARDRRTTDSLEYLGRALAIRQRLADQDPRNATWLRDLSVTFNVMARVNLGSGNTERALELYNKDLDIARRLSELDPTNLAWKRDLASSHQSLGELLIKLHRDTDARARLTEAAALFEDLAPRTPGKIDRYNDAAWARVLLGQIASRQGDPDSARRQWEQAVQALSPFITAPDTVDKGILDTYFRALVLAGRKPEADRIAQALFAKGWDDPEFLEMCKANGIQKR